MKRIVETLLEEGIDESTIHRVLDLIEEEYEVVDEDLPTMIDREYDGTLKKWDLKDKYFKNKDKEKEQSVKAGNLKHGSFGYIIPKGKSRESKTERGEFKTWQEQARKRTKKGDSDPYQIYKDPKLAVEKSIERNKSKKK